jgi:dipeptidyl-peptidase-4
MTNKGLLLIVFCFLSSTQLSAQKKQIALEEIWRDYKFFSESPEGFNFTNDGLFYTRLESNQQQQINEYDIRTGKQTRTIYSASTNARISSYSFSDNEKKILLETDPEQIYRHSSRAEFLVFDRETKSTVKVSEKGKQSFASFNASADKVAFVRANNIFIKDLKKQTEIQITTDGKVNEIINGSSDWVYEEEFSIDRNFFWSPDGNKIAFLRFDERKVKEFTLTNYSNQLYPIESKYKYPKAGELNANVTVHMYDLKSKKTIKIDVEGDGEYYIPRINWTPDGNLCIYRLNRLQNHLIIYKADTKGKLQRMFEEKNKYFIDINDHLTFVDKDKFIWMSDADGFAHLYLYDTNGKLVRQLTKGDWDVTNFYGYDPVSKKVYFQAAASGKSCDREVYWVTTFADDKVKISEKEGENKATFSKDFKFYISEYSNLTTPPVFSVVESESNKVVRVVEDNRSLNETLSGYSLGKIDYFNFKNDLDIQLNGWMMFPADFNAEKKYPVFMYVYGGPSTPTSTNQWDDGNHTWFRMLTQMGYIVVTVDNRGTEPRGEQFRKSTYMELGKFETQDQIAAARYLGTLSYVDKERIGIFGWSYGGYLSSLCITKGNAFFKMAIAVAPVTNWKWYDTIYTERYMRKPVENNNGYEDNSPINFADQIKGKYLLVHGLSDDNVHFQHSAEMARVLVEKNIDFDQLFYTNKNHGIYGGLTRLHLYRKMTDFIKNNL